jgi:hypothetical protein
VPALPQKLDVTIDRRRIGAWLTCVPVSSRCSVVRPDRPVIVPPLNSLRARDGALAQIAAPLPERNSPAVA